MEFPAEFIAGSPAGLSKDLHEAAPCRPNRSARSGTGFAHGYGDGELDWASGAR